MVDYKYFDLFQQDSVDKQLIIQFDNTTITNENLFNQSFILGESLCSEQELRFGSCEASSVKFKVANIVSPMKNKWITVKMVLNGHTDEPFMFGKYKVAEDKVTADRQWRDITAYDIMYDIVNSDVAAWYNSVLPSKDRKMTLKQFRESFIRHFGLTEVVPAGGLVNDNMTIEKTIDIVASESSESELEQVSVIGETLSGLDVITAICEINGCFGHITREGKFRYIYLPQAIQGLYPANNLFPDHAPDYLPWQQRTGHLYPQEPKSTRVGADGTYIGHPNYEDYLCKTIDKLQIRQEENDIGVIVGRTGENCYIIEDNFLVYGKGSEELWRIANNVFNKITDIVYRPFNADVKGNPCLEVGDPIRITTMHELIESYILQRTLKGTQALRDDYTADGVEMYSEQVNGVQKSILQLKGKSNAFERTIEETKSELKDVGQDVRSLYHQTPNSIEMSVRNGEKTAGIYISIKNKDGEEISNTNGDIVMTGIVTFKNLTGEEGTTRINGGLIETKTLSCNTLNGGEILGQIFKGGGLTIVQDGKTETEYYNFEVSKTKTTVRDKFYIADTDGNTYLSFNATGDNAKLIIKNTALSLGNDIVLDPEKNLAVFSTPQKILIKGRGNSPQRPGTWPTDNPQIYKSYKLSDGSTIKAWDIGDAIQYIAKDLYDTEMEKYDKDLNDKIDARLRAHGLIK
ncbi:MAG: hypothetical protein HDR01_05795 [Lachnospiraceae bacterium]|nr:hypothetical protein [Lachnospiraceae bacterium]